MVFLLGVILATPDMRATIAEGQAGGFPIATIVTSTLTLEVLPGITFGEIYLFVILASVFVCTMAIQGAASRLMFSMGAIGTSRWAVFGATFSRGSRRRPTPPSPSASSPPCRSC